MLSIVPRRDRALQRGQDGRRAIESKAQPWPKIECTNRVVANKAISAIRIADLPASLSTKARGSIRKWRPDKRKDGHGKDKKRKSDGRTAVEKLSVPARPKTPPGNHEQATARGNKLAHT